MPDNSPTITTILVTYRRPRELRRAIESVLRQTYPNWRLCICDDASGDETGDVARSFAELDPRVEYIAHPENMGAARNFAYGIDHVQTPYFNILADDDILLPECYERGLEMFRRYPEAKWAIGDTIYVGADGRFLGRSNLCFRPGLYRQPEALLAMCENPQPSWTGMIFRSEVRDIVGPLDTALFSMDYDYVVRLAALCPYALTQDPVAVYTHHAGQSTAVLQLHMIWPSRYAPITKLMEMSDIPLSVRTRAARILKADLAAMVWLVGLRAVTLRRFDEAAAAARLLADPLGHPAKGRSLRLMAETSEKHQSVVSGLLFLHNLRRSYLERRVKKQGVDLQKCVEYYERLGLSENISVAS